MMRRNNRIPQRPSNDPNPNNDLIPILPQPRKLTKPVPPFHLTLTLATQDSLHICLYPSQPSQLDNEVFEQLYHMDNLPNEAKNMFRTIKEMFEFMEMNFQASVKVKDRERNVVEVDLSPLKIPIRFDLPLRGKKYIWLSYMVEGVKRENRRLRDQIKELTQRIKNSEEIIRNNSLMEQGKIISLNQQLEGKDKQIQKLKAELVQTHNTINTLITQVEIVTEKNNKLNSKKHKLATYKNILSVKIYPQFKPIKKLSISRIQVLEELVPKPKVRLSNQFHKQLLKQRIGLSSLLQEQKKQPKQQPKNEIQVQQKKNNPFLTGLFSKNIFKPQYSNNSSNNNNQPPSNFPKENPLNPIQFPQISYPPLKLQTPQAQSRFHRYLQIQPNGQAYLNLSKRFIKDSDIDELVKYPEAWTKVCRLNLSENYITGKGLQTLFTIKWPSLKSLNISSNKIIAFDLNKLSVMVKMPNLLLFNLNFNSLTSDMLKALTEFSRNCKELRIHFNGNKPNGEVTLSKGGFF